MFIPNPSISIKVIFEDDDIIVIDKQAGVPCLPLKAGEKETVANGLAAHFVIAPVRRFLGGRSISNEAIQCIQGIATRPSAARNDIHIGIVHRLDNNTSGCLLAAKNQIIYEALREQFDENKIFKQYTALALGETPAEGVIETPIIHDPKDKKKMKIAPAKAGHPGIGSPALVGARGQNACTTFKLLKKQFAGRYSLLEVAIKTGVRHQIRVHLASIGHPIAGDKLYQNARQRARDKTGLMHQFLHASKIGFTHPGAGKWVEFSSPLPEELRNVLTKLDRV